MTLSTPATIRRFTGESEVASWTTRFVVWDGGENAVRGMRWHFVDSVVNEEVTVACGKIMPVEGVMPGVPLRFADSVAQESKCRTCNRIVDRRSRPKGDDATSYV